MSCNKLTRSKVAKLEFPHFIHKYNALANIKVAIMQIANPVKKKVKFSYYRLEKGIQGILSYANEGVRRWFKPKRPVYRQLCFKMIA